MPFQKGNKIALGRKHAPWNKGLHGIYSKEVRQRMGADKVGKPSWNKGLHGIYSEESLEKMRKARLGKASWCKGLTKKDNPDRIKWGYSEERNPRWTGGSRRYYQNVAFRVWEEKRGSFPLGKILHHTDGNYKNNSIKNLVAITWSEHEKIHQRNPQRNNADGRFKFKARVR